MGRAVFAPSPRLTVMAEELDGVPDVHVPAGGDGVWRARMIESLAQRPQLST